MPLEGIPNPRLKGACTRQEFKKDFIFYIKLLEKKLSNTNDKEFLVDGKVDRDSIISYLYQEYLNSYKERNK